MTVMLLQLPIHSDIRKILSGLSFVLFNFDFLGLSKYIEIFSVKGNTNLGEIGLGYQSSFQNLLGLLFVFLAISIIQICIWIFTKI